MRIGGAAIFFIGLIAAIVCSINGCHSFMSWNGRHSVDAFDLQVGENHQQVPTVTGRRYYVSVKAIFNPVDIREGVGGVAAAWLRQSLVVRVSDTSGTKLVEMTGWLDPNEPPNVFYTRSLHTPQSGGPHEISVERLVGPFMSASDQKVEVFVDLGADREMRTKVLKEKLVVYDDALPTAVHKSALGLAVSAVVALVGLVVLVRGWWARRRKKKRKIPALV